MTTPNQQFTQSKQLASKFNHSVVLFYNDQYSVDITGVIKEIKSIKYSIGNFASAEMIILDREKRIHNLYFFNNGNKIAITINNINGSGLYFEGKAYAFQAIDLDNDLYLLKIWSIWDSCNLKYVRKGFTGFKKISQIITETIEDELIYGKEISQRYKFIEETPDSLENFIIPGWNLRSIIDHFLPYSRDVKDNSFIFFENNIGLNFLSRENLFNLSRNKPIQSFQFTRNQKYDENKGTGQTLEQQAKQSIPYNVIYEYEMVNGFDASRHRENCDFGSNMSMFNYTDRSLTNHLYNIDDQFQNILTINRNSILGNDFMRSIKKNMTIEYTNNPSLIDIYGNYHTVKNMFNDYSIKFRTNFKSELNVGDFIRMDIPALIGSVDNLSGLWMIGEISHRMEISEGSDKQQRLSTYITCVRDSFNINKNIGDTLTSIRKQEKIISVNGV